MAKKKAPPSIRLRELRTARKLSQVALGQLVGASASRVSEWESGRHSPEAVNRIAVARLTKTWGDEIKVEDW